jgi:LysM repeat protein
MIPELMQQRITKRKLTSEGNRNTSANRSSVHNTKTTLLSRVYMFFFDKSILEWGVVITLVIFGLILGFSFFIDVIYNDEYQFDLVLDPDTDFASAYYNILVPDQTGDEQEFVSHPGSLKILTTTEYAVKKGETISDIARAFRLNMDTIISYNNIKSVRKIYPGMVLLIPNTDGIKYRVRKGDCLSLIARRFSISLNNLLDWNNVTTDVINTGDVFFIPGARMNSFELKEILGTLFKYPVRGRLSSGYGWRIHPISKKRHFHNGIDIAHSPGTPIKASMDGRVLKIGYNHIYGKYIIIRHENGFQTFYGHLRKVIVEKGAYVKQGKKIGEMGNTGYSTGSHLHFSIYKNGETVNPLGYLK